MQRVVIGCLLAMGLAFAGPLVSNRTIDIKVVSWNDGRDPCGGAHLVINENTGIVKAKLTGCLADMGWKFGTVGSNSKIGASLTVNLGPNEEGEPSKTLVLDDNPKTITIYQIDKTTGKVKITDKGRWAVGTP